MVGQDRCLKRLMRPYLIVTLSNNSVWPWLPRRCRRQSPTPVRSRIKSACLLVLVEEEGVPVKLEDLARLKTDKAGLLYYYIDHDVTT
jgi:hypothetical protein